MIIKTLSRRGNGSVTGLINYIFKERAVKPIERNDQLHSFINGWDIQNKRWTPPGITMTKQDWVNWDAAESAMKWHILLNKTYGGDLDKLLNDLYGQATKDHISHNVRSSSIQGIAKEFKQLSDSRLRKSSNQVIAHHDIISFSPEDTKNLDSIKLKAIADAYIRMRGDNTIAIGDIHWEKDHVHIHIVFSGTQLDGTATRISKGQLQDIKGQIQEYQRQMFPELTSIVDHGKLSNSRVSDKEAIKNIKIANGRNNNKVTLVELLERAHSTSHSVEEFISIVKEAGHEPYYRNERLQGIKFHGKDKFRFTNLGFSVESIEKLELIKENETRELESIRQIKEQSNEKSQKLDEFERFEDRFNYSQNNSDSEIAEDKEEEDEYE